MFFSPSGQNKFVGFMIAKNGSLPSFFYLIE